MSFWPFSVINWCVRRTLRKTFRNRGRRRNPLPQNQPNSPGPGFDSLGFQGMPGQLGGPHQAGVVSQLSRTDAHRLRGKQGEAPLQFRLQGV